MKFISTGIGTAANEMMPLSDELIVVKTSVNYDRIETDNPKNPFATVTGTCFEAMVKKRRRAFAWWLLPVHRR